MARGKSLATAFVDIKPDGSRFPGELKSQIQSKTGAAGKDVGNTFGKSLLAGMGAVLTAGVVIDFFKGAIAEAQEAAKVTRLTQAVIKSTGQAANVSAAQVADLAESMSELSGVDDEVIQSGANVLLTFTRIRNEAGKGNDIFDQGTEAALNLSAALGTDLQASMILVGKALNDPIAGLTALKKAGVQLTEQQKEQIRGFVEVGDVMSAQKIILAELTTQFGGAAAAAASPADKARVAWGNFQEEVGNKLLPTLNSLLTFATENSDWLAPLVGSVAALAVVIGTVIAAQKVWTAVQTVLGVSIDSTTRKAARAALVLGGIVTATQLLNKATSDTTDVDGLSDALLHLGQSNERGGELVRMFGKDLELFGLNARGASSSMGGFGRTVEDIVPGLKQLNEWDTGSSFQKSAENIALLDDALAGLARGGNIAEARAAVYQLMQAGKLTADEAEALFPKWNNANKEMQRGLTATAKAEIDASAAGQTLIDTWHDLNDTMLSADDAMLAAHEGIDGIKAAFEEGTKSVVGNTREVVENRVALEREAAAAELAAAELLRNGGSHADAAALIEDFKNQAIKATGATGAEADAVRELANRLFSIPPEVNSQVNVFIRSIVQEVGYAQYRAGERQADGGIIKFFAGGGFGGENHVAQIVKAGTWRVWGEDETGGEAYIPLAASKRDRSMDVLSEVADLFGYRLAPGEQAGSPVGSFQGTGSDEDVRELLAETRRTNKLLAELLPLIGPAVGAALTGANATAFHLARARP